VVFQNPALRIAKPLATSQKPTAHLSPFGFSPKHIANTKKPKKLKFLPALNQKHYV